MRTTLSIPDPLLHNAKKRAADRGVTLSAIVEDALRKDLAHDRSAPGEPFHLYTVRGRLVQPGLDLDRTSALLTADDEAEFGGGKR
jgi:hypothetical protein